MGDQKKWDARLICDLINKLVGLTFPMADAAYDCEIEKNLMTLIDITNWCIDGIADTATTRKSPYGSAAKVGERAYAALLEWKEWLAEKEEELA